MNASASNNDKLISLREEFDRSFAKAPALISAAAINMLAIQLGGVGYAIRVADIGGLFADRHIMPLPTQVPELLGVSAFRGQLAPVYDLAALLGYARQATPRWLVLLRMRDPVAFGFPIFNAHISIMPDLILHGKTDEQTPTTRQHLHDAVRTEQGILPIIDLPSIVENIRLRSTAPVKTKGKPL